MNIKLLTVGIFVGAFVLLAAPVQAFTIRQSQEMSNTVNVKTEGGTAEVKSESWGKQSQKVEFNTWKEDWKDEDHSWKKAKPYNWKSENTDGEVRLSWDHRGGICHIRYTEVNSRAYKYSTSAACDQGEITVGGLVQGRNYRFQVRKDDGSWSKPTVVKAW